MSMYTGRGNHSPVWRSFSGQGNLHTLGRDDCLRLFTPSWSDSSWRQPCAEHFQPLPWRLPWRAHCQQQGLHRRRRAAANDSWWPTEKSKGMRRVKCLEDGILRVHGFPSGCHSRNSDPSASRWTVCRVILSASNPHYDTRLSTCIKDAGIAVCHLRGDIISILQGPEMG